MVDFHAVVERAGGIRPAARELGIPESTLRGRLRSATPGRGPQFTAPSLPDDLPPIDELIAHRVKTFQRKQIAHDARKLIPITINVEGPIGVALFGDLHLDDDGCNWPLLQDHMAVVNATEGMYAASLGDLQNGWIGRLARKWADQSTSGREAWALVEWWVQSIGEKLLFIVEGNHDGWARNVNGLSPIQWIMSYQPGVSDSDGVRVELRLPCGDRRTINARHDFRGRSAWNAAHGPAKAAQMGWRDDIVVGGHTHESGYNVVKDPRTGKVSHALRVASYKYLDGYAKQEGFPDNNIFECPVAIFDPSEPDERHRVSIEFSPRRAADILTMRREKWKKDRGVGR